MKMYKIKANAEEAKSEVIPNLEKLGYHFHGVVLPNCDSVQAWAGGLISTHNNHSDITDNFQELSKEVLAKMCKPSFNDQLVEVEKARQECLKMENLKIRVNSEAESKEAQELFFELGYEKGMCSIGCYPAIIITTKAWGSENYCSTRALGLNNPAHENYKEITLPELRDMVVLKRNDVNDATHIDGFFYRFYKSSSDELYYYLDGFWTKFNNNSLLTSGVLKPIVKQMKEYIRKNSDGTFSYIGAVHQSEVHELMIEIHEDAEVVLSNTLELFFFKNNGKTVFFNGVWHDCAEYGLFDLDHYLQSNLAKEQDAKIVWQRPQQPESLPFVDDEKTGIEATLNDRESQYGSFEDVADITQRLLKTLKDGNSFEDLTAAQVESLHMICSKMARIVNGNPDHKDSWHDIAGYAKLIEDLI